jgi:hypothetical protein
MTDKLHKALLVMFSATAPGEVSAARDAVLRLAAAEKHDVHSLAALVLSRKPQTGEKPGHRVMAEHCLEMFGRGMRLSEKELKFVTDMAGWHRPSQKQIDWLESIYTRLKGGG